MSDRTSYRVGLVIGWAAVLLTPFGLGVVVGWWLL